MNQSGKQLKRSDLLAVN